MTPKDSLDRSRAWSSNRSFIITLFISPAIWATASLNPRLFSQQAVLETQKKLDRVLSFLLSGTIDENTYRTQKSELDDHLMKQKIKLGQTERRAQNWNALTENVFHFAKNASVAFMDGSDQVRREILMHIGSNHKLNDKKLFIDLHSWFLRLKEGEILLTSEIERFELSKNLTPKRQREAEASLDTTLCAGKDSNLRRPKPTDLQSVVIDHSTTDAYLARHRTSIHILWGISIMV